MSQCGRPPVVAIIPAHDEEPRIGAVVTGALAHVPVLVVDDGSTDRTAQLAAAAGASVLRQEPNRGKGAALRAGFRWALERDREAAITLDGDGQHDPAEIPVLLDAWLARAPGDRPGLVIGRRDFSAMPPVRRLANELGTVALSWAVGRRIPDNQSGYRLIGAPLMRELLDSDEPGFEFEVEMIARCIRDERSIAWVPIRTIYRGGPSHIRPWAHLTSFLRVTRLARRIVRQRGPG